jgi:dGTPase
MIAKGPLAPYACNPAASRGRRFEEPESPVRSGFQRDRDRVIHSTAFRRLKHKTQVFVFHEGDHYRTRLTHSLEVAQIARTICRVLRLDEDLGEALALAHDLGHTPFGHAGEDALDAAMLEFGGFDHNAQTLRILTVLERRYADFDGLNLTWETLEGVIKHNGPVLGEGAAPCHETVAAYNARHDLELDTFAGLEAQVAALADDIAYNNHDIDDGLRAELFTVDDLREVPLAGPVFDEVLQRYPGLERPRLIHESIRRMIDRMVSDLVRETESGLIAHHPESADDVRRLGQAVAGFSKEMAANDRGLKDFLFANMYRHDRVGEMQERARQVVTNLFPAYMSDPAALPSEWRTSGADLADRDMARLVADYIAGMTDGFALAEHDRLCKSVIQ